MAFPVPPGCPADVRTQIARFVDAAKEILANNLEGIYLHGSLAMGCFNPRRSDLDLLTATGSPMGVDTRRRLAESLLDLSGRPCPIELSVLTDADRAVWRHPLGYDFHYSEDWRDRYRRELADGSWQRWRHAETGDIDLAAHLTILHARGIVLVGDPIASVFPKVPRDDYIHSILADVDDDSIRFNVEHNPVYLILNLCRVYAYLRDERVMSKAEAGAWATEVIPEAQTPLLRQALAIYRGAAQETGWDRKEVLGFAGAMRSLVDGIRDIQT